MMNTSETGIRIEFSGHRPDECTLTEANKALAPIGARIWPLDLSSVSRELFQLLDCPVLTEEEHHCLKSHFLLPRERLIEIITEARGQPSIPGGGELLTLDQTNGVSYPQLYLADPNIDYSRFDRLHINLADNGVAVDEIAQIISGSGLTFHHQLNSGEILKIHLSCPSKKAGWLTTHSGGLPHIGSFSSATVGTKAIVQVIGPRLWKMQYVD